MSLLCTSVLSAAEIGSAKTALDMISSENYKEREAASEYLQNHRLSEKELPQLKILAGQVGEAATRAAHALDWQIYGLKPGAPQKAKDALEEYKKLKAKAIGIQNQVILQFQASARSARESL